MILFSTYVIIISGMLFHKYLATLDTFILIYVQILQFFSTIISFSFKNLAYIYDPLHILSITTLMSSVQFMSRR